DEDLKISLYDKDGFLLCEDYDGERKPFIRRGDGDFNSGEGHKLERDQEKHKVEVLKRMFGNEYFYGLGETTGHINKKGYSYIGWNSDNP
ncbi:MAG TPA: alpha-glucosidase, partial [Clostridiaceae bacterium]|nr:alpha-glucosidase [Clostridiaceae bacterium]